MDTGSRRERACAIGAVVLLHVLVVDWLVGWVPRVPAAVTGEDDALVVELIPRRAPRRDPPTVEPVAESVVTRRAVDAARMPQTSTGRPTPAIGDAGGTVRVPDVGRALDLRVPSRPIVIGSAPGAFDRPAPPDPFERPPPAQPSRTTRFEQAWAPDGDAIEAASWRSPVVRGLLSAFGGPPKKCDEVERRLRKPNCLPDEADFGP